jgi:hypothetical protein
MGRTVLLVERTVGSQVVASLFFSRFQRSLRLHDGQLAGCLDPQGVQPQNTMPVAVPAAPLRNSLREFISAPFTRIEVMTVLIPRVIQS